MLCVCAFVMCLCFIEFVLLPCAYKDMMMVMIVSLKHRSLRSACSQYQEVIGHVIAVCIVELSIPPASAAAADADAGGKISQCMARRIGFRRNCIV